MWPRNVRPRPAFKPTVSGSPLPDHIRMLHLLCSIFSHSSTGRFLWVLDIINSPFIRLFLWYAPNFVVNVIKAWSFGRQTRVISFDFMMKIYNMFSFLGNRRFELRSKCDKNYTGEAVKSYILWFQINLCLYAWIFIKIGVGIWEF